MNTNNKSKYIGVVSGVLVATGFQSLQGAIHAPALIVWWVSWLLRASIILTLSVGVLLFLRPRTFWTPAFCVVAWHVLSATHLLIFGYPSVSVGYKLAATLPAWTLSLVSMLCLLRARSSEVTSYA